MPTVTNMSLDPSYYYFQFEGSFASFVLSKVLFPKSSWICEFMHHLQCIVQAMKYTKCAQFCSGGVATCLTLELDVCQVVLSHGMDEMLCKGWKCFTSDLHPIASMPLVSHPNSSLCLHEQAVLPHAFHSPHIPHASHHCSMDTPSGMLQCP